jgi:hypothetical protein
MSDDFHHSAFIFELFKFVLLDNLSFDLFNGNNSMLPASPIDNTVSTFRQLFIVSQFIERYLVILLKSSGFIRDKIVFLLLLL